VFSGFFVRLWLFLVLSLRLILRVIISYIIQSQHECPESIQKYLTMASSLPVNSNETLNTVLYSIKVLYCSLGLQKITIN